MDKVNRNQCAYGFFEINILNLGMELPQWGDIPD